MSASFGAVTRLVGLLVGVVLAASPGTALAADPVVAAAGDIACDPADAAFNGGQGSTTACRQKYTSDLLFSGNYDAILPLGDNQYNSGSLANFQNSYALSWGRAGLKEKTYPAIGNHEGTPATSGSGYCNYFGAVAHCNSSQNQGGAAFYSWDIGTWHVVVLNSNCAAAGGCDVGSPQSTWLNQDLTQHPTTCTLAYWHHPRWSSGYDGSNAFMQPIWKLLYDKGADLVLSGHSHNYERFAPLDGDGAPNASNGMRQFVVGTGGAFPTGLDSLIANSEVGQNNTYGVLRLTLRPTGYDFSFVSESGKPFADSGSGACRDSGGNGTAGATLAIATETVNIPANDAVAPAVTPPGCEPFDLEDVDGDADTRRLIVDITTYCPGTITVSVTALFRAAAASKSATVRIRGRTLRASTARTSLRMRFRLDRPASLRRATRAGRSVRLTARVGFRPATGPAQAAKRRSVTIRRAPARRR